MSFMFKGPAALTTGSTIPAESVNAALSTAGTDLAIGDDLTVTDDLTVKDVIITNTGSLTVNGSTPITSIEGGGAVLVTKSYVDTAISNTHKVQVLIHAPSGVYPPIDLSTHHVYYFANIDYMASTPTILTCTVLTSPAPVNGHRVFIAWTRRGNPLQVTIKLNFGSQIVEGSLNTDRNQYIHIHDLYSSVLLYYVSAEFGGPRWLATENNETDFSNV